MFPAGPGGTSDPATVQALLSQLEEAQKRIEDSVTRAEMQTQIADTTTAARRVISSLEEKIQKLEEEKAALLQVKNQLHEDLQKVLQTQRALRQQLDQNVVDQRRIHNEEQKRMTEAHQAELERLAKVHEREMNEVYQQAIDAQNASDTTKEQLEEDLAELRRIMVDHDAAIVECAGRLHTSVRGERSPFFFFIRLAWPSLVPFLILSWAWLQICARSPLRLPRPLLLLTGRCFPLLKRVPAPRAS